MNVFYLHEDPRVCAEMHCDTHASKMCVEYAQLMSTAHRVTDGKLWYGRTSNGRTIARYFLNDGELNDSLYKASHINHPSNIWTRSSSSNYLWLYDMWCNLCSEFEYRYGKRHKSFVDLELSLLMPPMNIKEDAFAEPPPAMKSFPDCIVKNDSIASYRNYYWQAKRDFAKWTKRDKPEWWNERERIETKTPVCVTE